MNTLERKGRKWNEGAKLRKTKQRNHRVGAPSPYNTGFIKPPSSAKRKKEKGGEREPSKTAGGDRSFRIPPARGILGVGKNAREGVAEKKKGMGAGGTDEETCQTRRGTGFCLLSLGGRSLRP